MIVCRKLLEVINNTFLLTKYHTVLITIEIQIMHAVFESSERLCLLVTNF